ncbi:hypothetical protein [Brotaphodocola sp.]|uniref:hypothetical protein n=1 Tax=Brotaphodocola sp. TaxID=3073577 RepID=UPI003D7C7025
MPAMVGGLSVFDVEVLAFWAENICEEFPFPLGSGWILFMQGKKQLKNFSFDSRIFEEYLKEKENS